MILRSLVCVVIVVSLVVANDDAVVPHKPLEQGVTAGDTVVDGANMKLCWCPPGMFRMGSPPDEIGRNTNEEQVDVTLTRGFWLGKYEVTQADWLRVMGPNVAPWVNQEYSSKSTNSPCAYVNWDQVAVFCRVLTHRERLAGRLPPTARYTLPTEAQWEYACRAGTTTPYSFGSEKLEDHAWYGGLFNKEVFNDRSPHVVGLKKPNPWGLHDMHGNIREWCLDVYSQKRPGGVDPLVRTIKTKKGAEVPVVRGGNRVNRGGSWDNLASYCRSASRQETTSSRAWNLGFRIAIVWSQPE